MARRRQQMPSGSEEHAPLVLYFSMHSTYLCVIRDPMT
jgi:hypothetical protein